METIQPRQRAKRLLRCICSPSFLLSLTAIALSVVILVVTYLNNTIYIIDGNTTTVTVTMEQDARKILARESIPVTSNDLVELKTGDGAFAQLTVTRGFPVEITVDGATTTYHILGATVGQLLEEQGITLGFRDTVSLPLDQELSEGDHIEITRVQSRTRVETEPVIHEIVDKHTSVIGVGKTRMLEYGSNGTRQYTYEDIIEDGEIVESVLVDTTVTVEPVSGLRLVGDGSAVSSLDYSGDFPLDENGVPLGYTQVLTGQKATGYSARDGAYGAAVYSSARSHPDVGECVAGTVAVNPNVIPYGTRMYIRTPDGKFVYGYAIANDTGTGMMQGVVSVDLFYDTYTESLLNSVRYVDIYILD